MPRNEDRNTNSDRGSSRQNSDRRGSKSKDKDTNSLNGFESEIDGQIEPSDEKEE